MSSVIINLSNISNRYNLAFITLPEIRQSVGGIQLKILPALYIWHSLISIKNNWNGKVTTRNRSWFFRYMDFTLITFVWRWQITMVTITQICLYYGAIIKHFTYLYISTCWVGRTERCPWPLHALIVINVPFDSL